MFSTISQEYIGPYQRSTMEPLLRNIEQLKVGNLFASRWKETYQILERSVFMQTM